MILRLNAWLIRVRRELMVYRVEDGLSERLIKNDLKSGCETVWKLL